MSAYDKNSAVFCMVTSNDLRAIRCTHELSEAWGAAGNLNKMCAFYFFSSDVAFEVFEAILWRCNQTLFTRFPSITTSTLDTYSAGVFTKFNEDFSKWDNRKEDLNHGEGEFVMFPDGEIILFTTVSPLFALKR